MATPFTATVKSSGGDYATLSAAEAGLQNDLTAATIKVFSISAYSAPTIVAGDTVLGQTSGATGVCVLVNAARTQILIKTIAVAAFQSGEVVQKTADAGVNVILSDAGDGPIIRVECYSVADTSAVNITGWTTSATNYIRCYGAESDRTSSNTGKWSTERYTLTTAGSCIVLGEEYIRIEALQLSNSAASGGYGIGFGTTAGEKHIIGNIIRATGASPSMGIYMDDIGAGLYVYIINNIIYGWNTGIMWDYGNTINGAVYNNTVHGCIKGASPRGIWLRGGTAENNLYLKNNLCNGNTTDYWTQGLEGSATNLSEDATSPQTGLRNLAVSFIDEGTNDFHLASGDSYAKDAGTDLSADSYYPFSADIDGQTRSGTWDIGADEYVAAGGKPWYYFAQQ